ncbi:MAG: hypothetical protein U1F34_03690 [Gammaproteobacteria bacterium]
MSADEGAYSWLLDLYALPVGDIKERRALSLRNLWQPLTRHYDLGLQALRTRNTFGLFPTEMVPESSNNSDFILRFMLLRKQASVAQIKRKSGQSSQNWSWDAKLVEMGLDGHVQCRFALGNAVTTLGDPLVVSANVDTPGYKPLSNAASDQPSQWLAKFKLSNVDVSPRSDLLLGGVLLANIDAGSGAEADVSVQFGSARQNLGQPPLEVRLVWEFECDKPISMGEAAERGFETEERWLQRERSIVIPLPIDARNAPRVKLQAFERAGHGQSRRLEMQLRAAKDKLNLGVDVVVIDPGPLTVARIIADTEVVANRDDLIASYVDEPGSLPGWEFKSETGRMTIVFPPQSIGEEMIKGNLTILLPGENERVTVPLKDKTFDFRLSPTTLLSVDRTDIATARAPSPWSLRRLLDRREGVVGVQLTAAEFELLYGLTTRLRIDDKKFPKLRLAEQAALLGRIPFASELLAYWEQSLDGGIDPEKDLRTSYARKLAKWIGSLHYRSVQWPVFRDWSDRRSLVINDDVNFDWRTTRQTADPFQLEKYATNKPDGEKRLPLRGGVDFAFESRNIYQAAHSNPDKSSPGESQGHVTGLTFGTFGGTGAQQAAFDEGRTLIITDTKDGRLNSLTLVRVGRIAMLWNHARHVIVYERSTRRVPRYVNDQPEYNGLAALRKVKEYIEITQQRRTYPDFPVDRPTPGGPLIGCFFETTVIPVKSSWGRDVTDGWTIPLHGPLDSSEETYYPLPNISLEFARAPEKGEGKINSKVLTPERLLFFSSTRKGDGGNPDAWSPRPDIDFSVTHRPQVPGGLSYLPAFQGSRQQPDAQMYDFGQRRFTVDVAPAEEAVNLRHGRPGDGLEARIRNVALARGQPPGPRGNIDTKCATEIAKNQTVTTESIREIAQHLEHLAISDGSKLPMEVSGLVENVRNILRDANTFEKTITNLADNKEELEKLLPNWKEIQESWYNAAKPELDKIAEQWKVQLADAIDAAKEQSQKRIADIKSNDLLLDEIKNRLRAAVESVFQQAISRAEGLAFLPERVVELIVSAEDHCKRECKTWLKSVQAGWSRLFKEIQTRYEDHTHDAVNLYRELIDAMHAAAIRARDLGKGSGRMAKDQLGPWMGDVKSDGAVVLVAEAIEAVFESFAEWVEETAELVPPFDLGTPNWNALNNLLSAEFFESTDTLLKSVFSVVTSKMVEATSKLESWVNGREAVIAKITTSRKKLLDEIEKLKLDDIASIATPASDFLESGRKQIDDLSKLAVLEVDNLTKNIPFDSIAATFDVDSISGRIDALKKAWNDFAEVLDTGKTVRELAELARDLTHDVELALQSVSEQIEQAVVNEVGDAVEGVRESALEMVRTLAEGPVTDTMECTREWVGYYYEAAKDALGVTPSAAMFNELGKDVLNSLSAQVPFDQVRDRVIAQLKNFDLNKLFPDFAGLKLSDLFGDFRIPEDPFGEYEWLKLKHGFDKQRLSAWSEVAIDKKFEDSPDLFTLSPVAVSVREPYFKANSRFEADKTGAIAQNTTATLIGDWIVSLNNEPLLTLQKAGLYYDGRGGLRFDFKSKDLQLAPALQFVADAIKSFFPSNDGLTITPLLPGGVSAEYSVPLPDIGTGAFTLTGVTLYTHFDLLVMGGFEIRTGLWISRPDRPFGLAILFLGGGGWFGVDVSYKPPDVFETRVSIGISAGAFIAVNFGFAGGSAGILFTAGLDFYQAPSNRNGDVAISVGLLIWGEFNIVAIASAYVRLVLRTEYREGAMTGYGRLSVSIKICWCFTLKVNNPITMPLKSAARRANGVEPKKLLKAHFDNLAW